MSEHKILLINPPFYRLMNSHFNGLSLGLGYIAAVLSQHGFNIKIYNADFEPSEKYSTQREIFEGYSNYKKILNDKKHPIWTEVKQVIREYNPTIIGISMLTGTFKSAQNIAHLAKEINPRILTIVGGTHATILPDEILKICVFDLVIRQEGEFSFLDVVNGEKYEEIKGLSYKDSSGKIFHNPDRDFIENLDSLPFPARELYLNDRNTMDFGYILTARGCPFECSFCASKKIWMKKVRFRSPENVVREINEVFEKFGTNFFYFIDDTFTLNKPRAAKICQLLIEKNLPITWICDTRIDALDESLLSLMKSAGCVRVKIGVESGSDRILKKVKKNITIQQIRDAVTLIKNVGIDFTIYLMVGFPSETKEEMQDTLNLAHELDPTYCSISILAPYPGTEIYDDLLKSHSALPLQNWEYYNHQSKDLMMVENVDEILLKQLLALNERNGKVRQ